MDRNDTICTSVFQNGKTEPDVARFTRIWIDLINKMEQSGNHYKGRS